MYPEHFDENLFFANTAILKWRPFHHTGPRKTSILSKYSMKFHIWLHFYALIGEDNYSRQFFLNCMFQDGRQYQNGRPLK